MWPVVTLTASDGADITPRRSIAVTVKRAVRFEDSGTGTEVDAVCL